MRFWTLAEIWPACLYVTCELSCKSTLFTEKGGHLLPRSVEMIRGPERSLARAGPELRPLQAGPKLC